MAKTLDKIRPKSTIADMIDGELIEQATQISPPEVAPEVLGVATQPNELVEVSSDTSTTATAAPSPSAPNSIPGVGERTGEHSDIQKMYRLTPTAVRTLQELSRCLSRNLGFEINNSAVIRSILRVVHQAEADIHRLADERIKPRRQPPTAIGNEHLRDALETELADVIMSGIRRYADNNKTSSKH